MERLLEVLAPYADGLERRFRAALRRAGSGGREFEQARIRALSAITPAAAARQRTLPAFFEQVNYNGRRLAKLNVPPEEAYAGLDAFGALTTSVLGENLQPAREQLRLATVLALAEAFYEVREAEAQALFSFYQAESEAAGVEDALRRIVRAITRALRARSGRLVRWDGLNRRLAAPLYIEKDGRDRSLVCAELRRGRHACYWSYPVNGQAALQFAFATRYPWLPRELTLLAAAAARCAGAMERARMERQARERRGEALRAEQQERRRIGRELHDQTCQSLLALRLELEILGREASPASAARLRAARHMAEGAIAELRRAIAALRPEVVERLGLRTALRRAAERFLQASGCELRLSLSRRCDALPPEQAEAIYRVAEECLRNCARHSGAAHVNLSLRSTDKGIKLKVSDDGSGFDAAAVNGRPMSFGLAGMRERAAILGGWLAIRSAPGEGTAITLSLPPGAAMESEDVKTTGTAN